MIYDGRFFEITEYPLQTFPWPGDKRQIFEIAPGEIITGNYRGYRAIWEIIDRKIFLAGLDSFYKKSQDVNRTFTQDHEKPVSYSPRNESERADLKKIFPSRFRDGRVFADWFTGTIRIPDGKILKYIRFDNESVYERDILFHFESGVLKRSEVKTNILPESVPKSSEKKEKA